jgi:hypothetical protein
VPVGDRTLLTHARSRSGATGLRGDDLAAAVTVGRAHLSNFGAFASPERNLVLDVNDFDKTLSRPFET